MQECSECKALKPISNFQVSKLGKIHKNCNQCSSKKKSASHLEKKAKFRPKAIKPQPVKDLDPKDYEVYILSFFDRLNTKYETSPEQREQETMALVRKESIRKDPNWIQEFTLKGKHEKRSTKYTKRKTYQKRTRAETLNKSKAME